MNALLDVEPIRPGEDECGAALRLLGRVRRLYGPRFFDAITVEAWYVQGPFLRAVEKLGWPWEVAKFFPKFPRRRKTDHLPRLLKAIGWG